MLGLQDSNRGAHLVRDVGEQVAAQLLLRIQHVGLSSDVAPSSRSATGALVAPTRAGALAAAHGPCHGDDAVDRAHDRPGHGQAGLPGSRPADNPQQSPQPLTGPSPQISRFAAGADIVPGHWSAPLVGVGLGIADDALPADLRPGGIQEPPAPGAAADSSRHRRRRLDQRRQLNPSTTRPPPEPPAGGSRDHELAGACLTQEAEQLSACAARHRSDKNAGSTLAGAVPARKSAAIVSWPSRSIPVSAAS